MANSPVVFYRTERDGSSMSVFAVRVADGKEEEIKAQLNGHQHNRIGRAVSPRAWKGYVLVEASDIELVREALSNQVHFRGVLSQPIRQAKVAAYFGEKDVTVGETSDDESTENYPGVGRKVQVTKGPLEGKRGKVVEIDYNRKLIIISFYDVLINKNIGVFPSEWKYVD